MWTYLELEYLTVSPYRSGHKSKPRQMPIGLKTKKAIWKYLSLREEKNRKICMLLSLKEPLFISKFGKSLNKDSLRQLIDEIAKKAGVLNAHPHKFRHTFAIQYLRNGGDVFTLKRILGHSSLKMVNEYLQIAQIDIATTHRRASPADNWNL